MKQKEYLLAGLLLLPLTAMAALEASDLRVESLRSPLGIDTQTHGIVSVTYSIDGCQFTPVAIPFQAREGKWIGAKYGVFSITHDAKSKGWVDLKFCATPFNE